VRERKREKIEQAQKEEQEKNNFKCRQTLRWAEINLIGRIF
jgi:hypothetical protein